MARLGKLTEEEVERKWEEEFRNEAEDAKEKEQKKEAYEEIEKTLAAQVKAGKLTAMEGFKKAGEAAVRLGGASEKEVAEELARLGLLTEKEAEEKWEEITKEADAKDKDDD